MMTTGVRSALRVALVSGALLLLVTACTSEPSSDLASSSDAPVAETTAQSLPGSSGATEPVDAAGEACAAYFQLDLLNSTYAGGAVADGDMTEAQVRADFTRLLRIIVVNGRTAVAEGAADAKLVANSVRMRKAVKGLSKNQALSDLSRKQQVKFATQSSRVQKACNRAGFPLPEDNITARTAAGI
jgi:hypothetical protein